MTERVRALEALLGSPLADGPFGYAAALSLDEAEAFPAEACARLDAWGLPDHYVPAALGGRLDALDEGLAVLRSVARRDLTVAIGHAKTLLGAMGVWLAGTPAQRADLAARVRRGEPVALALTERAHGADLLATGVVAEPRPGGFALSGEKWLINNATRSTVLTVLARTGERGPRATSLLLVDKAALAEGTWAPLPKVRTHGIRGADISGVRFEGARVPASAVLGPPGTGLDEVLRGFQVTRTLCAGLSLGAFDAALGVTVGFARARQLYGGRMFDLPAVRDALAVALVERAMAEAVATVGARTVHEFPEQMALVSAVVKGLVPSRTQDAIEGLASLLGARAYLRDELPTAIFQKVRRDHALVPLFDGSVWVNRYALAVQLRAWGRRPPRATPDLSVLADPARPLSPLALDRLVVRGTSRNDVVEALPETLDALAEADLPTRHAFAELRGPVLAELRACTEAAAAVPPAAPHAMPAAAFEIADRLARLYAVGAVLLVLRHGRDGLADWARDGAWAVAAVRRLLGLPASVLPSVEGLDTDGLWAGGLWADRASGR